MKPRPFFREALREARPGMLAALREVLARMVREL